jgi:hypothetical protein
MRVTSARENQVLRSRQMEAAVWTAIGLLAALSLGTLFYLGARIDALADRLDSVNGRIDTLSDSVSGRIDSLSSRIDERFDRVDDRLARLEQRRIG